MSRVAAAALAVTTSCALASCRNVDDDLAAGRIRDACERARTHPDEAPRFAAWLADNARVDVALVPRADVEGALGGPVRGYGSDIGLYAVTPSLPGGAIVFDALDARGRGPDALVRRLPDLVALSSTPKVPGPLDAAALAPEPRSSHARGGDLFSALVDAVGAVGTGIGIAVGTAVAVPIGALVGIANGIGTVVDALTGRAPPVPFEDLVAPVRIVDPPAPNPADALLGPAEHAAAQAAVDAEAARYADAVLRERDRRVALAKDPAALGLTSCAGGRGCRAILDADRLPFTVDGAVARFGSGAHVCDAALPPLVLRAPPAAAAASPAPLAGPALDVDTARARLLSMSTALDAGAPPWSRAYPAPTHRDVDAHAAPPPIHDLACDVRVDRAGFDDDGTAPDLVVRVTAGGARVRAESAFLGLDRARARVLVPGVDLTAGDHLRLSVVSQARRSLGGAVAVFDGSAPLVLRGAVFRATCGVALPLPSRVLERERHAALAAVAALEAAPPPDGTMRTLQHRDRLRETAEAAVVALAGDVGFADDAVRALLARLTTASGPPAPR